MTWQSDQNPQLNCLLNTAWTLTEPENKLYCSYEYSVPCAYWNSNEGSRNRTAEEPVPSESNKG